MSAVIAFHGNQTMSIVTRTSRACTSSLTHAPNLCVVNAEIHCGMLSEDNVNILTTTAFPWIKTMSIVTRTSRAYTGIVARALKPVRSHCRCYYGMFSEVYDGIHAKVKSVLQFLKSVTVLRPNRLHWSSQDSPRCYSRDRESYR